MPPGSSALPTLLVPKLHLGTHLSPKLRFVKLAFVLTAMSRDSASPCANGATHREPGATPQESSREWVEH
jgi:hypothetical protein